jgi:hypothetical protein
MLYSLFRFILASGGDVPPYPTYTILQRLGQLALSPATIKRQAFIHPANATTAEHRPINNSDQQNKVEPGAVPAG